MMKSILAVTVASLVLLAGIIGCTTTVGTKRVLIEKAMSHPDERRQFLEATLRVFDENPEYIAEMFEIVRQHPDTLDNFLEATAADLEDPQLARKTAQRLVGHPESVYQVMVETLEAAGEVPEAQEAIARAIEDRAELAAAAMKTRPPTIERITIATAVAVADQPEPREAFLAGMRGGSGLIATMLAGSPETLSILVGDLMQHAAKSRKVANVIAGQTVGRLGDPEILEAMTSGLAKNPGVLAKVMVGTMKAAGEEPLARQALAGAIGDNPELVMRVVSARPEAVYPLTLSMVAAAERTPAVREAVLRAIRQRHEALTRIILSDPETAAAVGGALVREGLQSSSLADRIMERFRRRKANDAATGGSGE